MAPACEERCLGVMRRSGTHAADKDDHLETLAEDGHEGEDEERPLSAAALSPLVRRELLVGRLRRERRGELGLPLDLRPVNAEHAEAGSARGQALALRSIDGARTHLIM
jgi:hypothetical protein